MSEPLVGWPREWTQKASKIECTVIIMVCSHYLYLRVSLFLPSGRSQQSKRNLYIASTCTSQSYKGA
eukprot:1155910-Pelagomonas_calceolata.AAC.6